MELNDNRDLELMSAADLRTLLKLQRQETVRLRGVIQRELDGCWCDDRDGNCNPPHNELCERCKRLAAALTS